MCLTALNYAASNANFNRYFGKSKALDNKTLHLCMPPSVAYLKIISAFSQDV